MEPYFYLLRYSVENLLRTTADRLPYWALAVVVFGLTLMAADAARRVAVQVVRRAHAVHQAEQLVARLAYLLVLTIGVVWALSLLGLQITAVATGLGLTALAVGLAVKPVLENLIAGTLLLFERPFALGDVIAVAGHEGTVTQLALRVTHLQTLDGVEVLVPNAQVYQSVLVNKSRYGARRMSFSLWVERQAALGPALAKLQAAASAVAGVAAEPPVELVVDLLGKESVLVKVYYWVDAKSTDPSPNRVRAEVAAALVATSERVAGAEGQPGAERQAGAEPAGVDPQASD